MSSASARLCAFSSGYRVAGFPIGHPPPKTAKSAAGVLPSFATTRWGTGVRRRRYRADDAFTKVTVRVDRGGTGGRLPLKGHEEKAPPRLRHRTARACGAPIRAVPWYDEGIPKAGVEPRAASSGRRPFLTRFRFQNQLPLPRRLVSKRVCRRTRPALTRHREQRLNWSGD